MAVLQCHVEPRCAFALLGGNDLGDLLLAQAQILKAGQELLHRGVMAALQCHVQTKPQYLEIFLSELRPL